MSLRPVVVTGDGSHTVSHADLGVTYHSVHGAVTESKHVFVSNGLEHQASSGLSHLNILEVGFGTGLNALLTYLFWSRHRDIQVTYHGVESDPLSLEIVRELNYAHLLGDANLEKILLSMHSGSFVTDSFALTLFDTPILAHRSPSRTYDLVYYDAFAPGAQPEMWNLETLGYVSQMLSPGAVLVTYCAQGQFKRNLKSLGFRVEALPGPPGKREIVRATLY